MARLPSVELARKPRMADFARILAAVDAELGTGALASATRSRRPTSPPRACRATRSPAGSRPSSRPASRAPSAELLADVKPGDPEWKAPKDWPRLGAAP